MLINFLAPQRWGGYARPQLSGLEFATGTGIGHESWSGVFRKQMLVCDCRNGVLGQMDASSQELEYALRLLPTHTPEASIFISQNLTS